MAEHTFRFGATPNDRCPVCESRDCVHRKYSKRYVRFVQAHREAFDAAYLDGNPQAARNELERLDREWVYVRSLRGHDCTCDPQHCWECRKLAAQRVKQDVAVEIGRTSPVEAPMPMPLMLDVNAGYVS